MATVAAPQANKIITVFGNGLKDNRGRKLVINRRTAPSYDRVLTMLSKLIELPGGVRKLYTLPDCKLIKNLDMLSGCTNTDFVAVGNAALDRSKLALLSSSSSSSSSGGVGGPKSARSKSKAASSPRGSSDSKESSGRGAGLNKHKQLPGIAPAANSGSAAAAPPSGEVNGPLNGEMHMSDVLPGINDEPELQSSTKLQPFQLQGDNRPIGNHTHVAEELMNAASAADHALDSERDRQRRAHQERMSTRQRERENEQTRKLEAYAEGAEKVDSTIDDERARQQKAFRAKLSQRMRTNDKLGKTTDGKSRAEREYAAATTIQANYRGYATRKSLPKTDSGRFVTDGSKSPKPGKKGKGKKKKKRGSKKDSLKSAASTPPPSDKSTPSDPSGPMSSKELLAVKRIPTPDLSISAGEIEDLQIAAATKIKAAYKGYASRKINPPPPLMQSRLDKERRESQKSLRDKVAAEEKIVAAERKAVADAAAAAAAASPSPDKNDKAREKREKKERAKAEKEAKKKLKAEKGAKKKRKKKSTGDAAQAAPASPGETQATKLERQTSRFSTKGIEERSKVEEKYTIGKKIGDGNFAVVKECVHKETGKQYALKIIDKSKTQGAKETKMIENEVHTMKSVKHPNCVGLYDVYDTKDELFLVMELVTGGDLFDRIVDKGKYDESDAVRLVRNMATALNHLHEQNIIHRDLKPENLLVTQDEMGRDTLKLADFGLSMVVKGPLRTICGTPTYVAPEIISESPEGYGLQVDLWATGVIAYIMLCGFPPFASQSKNQKDLFRKIKAGKFTFPMPYWKGISEDAKDLIRNLLKVNPEDRYTAAQLLAHPWIANGDEGATNL